MMIREEAWIMDAILGVALKHEFGEKSEGPDDYIYLICQLIDHFP